MTEYEVTLESRIECYVEAEDEAKQKVLENPEHGEMLMDCVMVTDVEEVAKPSPLTERSKE